MRNLKKYMRITIILLVVFTFFSMESFSQNQLPNIDLKLLDGNVLERKSLKNNFVIVNLWATWCKPCIAEIPELNMLVLEYKNKEVKFLALAADDSTKLRSFLIKKKFDFIHLDKVNSKYFDKGFLKIYPRTLVYDRTGKLIKKYTGQITGENLKELKKLIE